MPQEPRNFKGLRSQCFGTVLAWVLAMLAYEDMDVYRCAIQFLGLSSRALEGMPKGNSGLAGQLKRAALCIPLNIAESSGEAG